MFGGCKSPLDSCWKRASMYTVLSAFWDGLIGACPDDFCSGMDGSSW